jgi:DNA-binding SARP family transcriptional activator/tetratricopeptide (TPR) repeat protein
VAPPAAANAGIAGARFRLVGDFAVFTQTGAQLAVANKRGRALLAYLYLAPEQSASREQLGSLLWSDRGEPQARANLRQCLGDLREVLAKSGLDLVDFGRHRIALRIERVTSDLTEIEAALSGGDARAAAQSLANNRRLLDDLEIGGLFEDWLRETRVQLEQVIASAVHSHLDRLEGAGRWREIGPVADAFLHRDPLDEAVVAAAIRSDVATGNAAGAHRRFRVLHDALARELGVEPGFVARDALGRATRAVPEPLDHNGVEIHPAASEPVTQIVPPLVIVAAFKSSGDREGIGELASILREEIVSGLSRFRDLRVITDPRPMDNVEYDASARQYGDYLLGASLVELHSDARLVVHLSRLDSRQVIWSSRLSASRSQMVEVIDTTIAKTVGAVLPSIDADLLRGPSNLPGNSAYRRYLTCRNAVRSAGSFEAARAAADMLETMIAESPSFALPYLSLAALYNTDFGYTRAGSSSQEDRARAAELANRALALDRAQANAYTATGWSYLWLSQWAAARRYFDQALALNPFHSARVMEVGFGLLLLGEIDTARTLLNRCLLLNPAPEDVYFSDLGLLEFLAGNYELASGHFSLIARHSVWSSLYAALNETARGVSDDRAVRLAWGGIRRIWPPETPMTIERTMSWIDNHHPFRTSEMKDRFLPPIRAMLLNAMPFA